jgi:hypothetical protein
MESARVRARPRHLATHNFHGRPIACRVGLQFRKYHWLNCELKIAFCNALSRSVLFWSSVWFQEIIYSSGGSDPNRQCDRTDEQLRGLSQSNLRCPLLHSGKHHWTNYSKFNYKNIHCSSQLFNTVIGTNLVSNHRGTVMKLSCSYKTLANFQGTHGGVLRGFLSFLEYSTSIDLSTSFLEIFFEIQTYICLRHFMKIPCRELVHSMTYNCNTVIHLNWISRAKV